MCKNRHSSHKIKKYKHKYSFEYYTNTLKYNLKSIKFKKIN